MESGLLTLTIKLVIATAQAQSNYSITNAKHLIATYKDISNSGIPIAMNVESGTSSTPINIGFNFSFNGTVFTQCMIMQTGEIRIGGTG